MGVGDITIVPCVREAFGGDEPPVEYKSGKPHIRIAYGPIREPVGVARAVELSQP